MPDRITRRSFLKASTTAGAAGALAGTGTVAGAGAALAGGDDHVPPFAFEEKTIAELQAAMTSGRLSSRRLTQAYLRRIRRIDLSGIQLNSVIEVNPDALEIAAGLDAERRGARSAGPCTASPSWSRTTSPPATRWRRPPGRWPCWGPRSPGTPS